MGGTELAKFTTICVVTLMLGVVGILLTTWYATLNGYPSTEDLLSLTDAVLSPAILGGAALFGFKDRIAAAIDRWLA